MTTTSCLCSKRTKHNKLQSAAVAAPAATSVYKMRLWSQSASQPASQYIFVESLLSFSFCFWNLFDLIWLFWPFLFGAHIFWGNEMRSWHAEGTIEMKNKIKKRKKEINPIQFRWVVSFARCALRFIYLFMICTRTHLVWTTFNERRAQQLEISCKYTTTHTHTQLIDTLKLDDDWIDYTSRACRQHTHMTTTTTTATAAAENNEINIHRTHIY